MCSAARASSRFAFGSVGALGLWASLASTAALAGPPEWFSVAELDPRDPTHLVIAYENAYGGLLFSDDAGRSFRARCLRSVSDWGQWSASRPPAFALLANDTVLVPLSVGLFVGTGRGCAFAVEPSTDGRNVGAVARHPADADVAFFHLGVDSRTASCQRSGLVRRNADGTTTELGKNDTATRVDGTCGADFSATSLQVVARAGSALRFRELGTRRSGSGQSLTSTAYLRFSDDDGATFSEQALSQEIIELGGAMSILALSPKNPDHILLRVRQSAASDVLFLSKDRGQTYARLLDGEVSAVTSVAVASDGRVWLGDRGSDTSATAPRGLWSLPSLDATPTRLNDADVHCLAFDEASSTLFGCTTWEFGTFDVRTGAFSKRSHISDDTLAFASCPGEDLASACKQQMCGEAWCGPLHWAESPICGVFNSTWPCCGWSARDFDARAKDGGAAIAGACRQVLGGELDGGAAGSKDAGSQADSALDSGSGIVSGATNVAPHDASMSDVEQRHDSGCSVARAASVSRVPQLALLALFGFTVLRRRCRACRAGDFSAIRHHSQATKGRTVGRRGGDSFDRARYLGGRS